MREVMDMMAKKLNLSEDGRLSMGFRNFLHVNQITADELEEAYYRLMGVSDRTDGDKIELARREMASLADRHFPVNRFKDLIELRRKQEGK